VDVSLSETLFITENAEHILACRAMGMATLQFGSNFECWTDAPLLVAHLVGPANPLNLAAALRPPLSARYNVRLESVESLTCNSVRCKARAWAPLDAPDLGPLRGVHVEAPVEVNATLDSAGRLAGVEIAPPPADYVAEVTDSARSLLLNGQISGLPVSSAHPQQLPTHRVETGADGRRFLVRRRFTAW